MCGRLAVVAVLIIGLVGISECGRRPQLAFEAQHDDAELERRLQSLNKTPEKTLTTREGHIYDCIPINKQPAFDHPALKNHKIQLHPTSFPVSSSSRKSASLLLHDYINGETCPDGTVPIKRVTKESLIAADSLVLVPATGTKMDQKNSDASNKGCYNTFCSGFVQIDKSLPINYQLPHSSYADHPLQQYKFHFVLNQDTVTGNWWLIGVQVDLADGNEEFVSIGYWPSELFTELKNGGDTIAWGGTTYPGKDGIYPNMGNGLKPFGSYFSACFWENIHLITDGYHRDITAEELEIHVDSTDCYNLEVTKISDDADFLIHPFSFTFGGPGRTTCPGP
ncbi:hypothetical protein QQ045_010640 [Rhodiola kirilowii]